MNFLHLRQPMWAALPVVVAWACSSSTTSTTQTLEDQTGSGSLQVVLVTVGDTLDPDGYLVGIDEELSQAVGGNETVTFDALPVGGYMVSLTDVADFCVAQPPNPASVTVIRDAMTDLLFNVTCTVP